MLIACVRGCATLNDKSSYQLTMMPADTFKAIIAVNFDSYSTIMYACGRLETNFGEIE